MTPLETLRIAGHALSRNKMRSFLTTLGVIIGVSAVIAMVAIGEGAKAQVEQAFASMGANLLIIIPGTTTAGGAHGGFGTLPTLTWEDLKAIQTEIPSVRYAAPALRATAQVLSEDQNWTTSVTGTTPEFFDIRSWPVVRGTRFTQSDGPHRRPTIRVRKMSLKEKSESATGSAGVGLHALSYFCTRC